MIEALSQVKPVAGLRLGEQIAEMDDDEAASRLLEKVRNIKGPFAQALAELLADPESVFEVPPYLRRAIEWATGQPEAAAENPPI